MKTLYGGRSTRKVIRIGNKVYRTTDVHSPFVHELLQLLNSKNFKGAPKFIGLNEEGREILTFLEGEVPREIEYYNNKQLICAAELIKEYHDATAHSNLASNEEIVCHNDLTPCNTVFVNELPVALIDFDAAAPGTRMRDLGYAVWQWCNLGNENISTKEQAKRIKLFLNAYGVNEYDEIISAILKRQEELIRFCKSKADTDDTWSKAQEWGERCHRWLLQNKNELIKAIIEE